jgi:phosphoribosylformylglycinamidine synthase
VLVSEAQERMSVAVPPEHIEAFLDLARRREVEATDLGEFTDSGVFHVTWEAETVAWLPMDFLHEGLPEMRLTARHDPPSPEDLPPAPEEDLGEVLAELLARPNLASNESMARHYDHEVKGLSVIKPWIGPRGDLPADATVFTARHGERSGFVLSEGINPFFSDLDAGAMAVAAVDLALRRAVGTGARLDHLAALDNFCWPDPVRSERTPDGEHKLAQLVRACRGLHEACVTYGVPLISGKDSMKNDAVLGGVKISIPPTLLVSAIGRIERVDRAVTCEAKAPGHLLYLLGATAGEIGGSEYLRLRGTGGGDVPRAGLEENLALYRALEAAIGEGLVRSSHALHLGGLGAGLARVAMGGELGLDVDLGPCADLRGLRPDLALFSESLGRSLVTVAPGNAPRFERALEGHPCERVGVVTEESRLRVRLGGGAIVDLALPELKRRWQATLAD